MLDIFFINFKSCKQRAEEVEIESFRGRGNKLVIFILTINKNRAWAFVTSCRCARGRVYKRRCWVRVCVRRTLVCRARFYLLSLVLTSLTSVVHILLFPLGAHTVNYVSVISRDTGDDKNPGSVGKRVMRAHECSAFSFRISEKIEPRIERIKRQLNHENNVTEKFSFFFSLC